MKKPPPPPDFDENPEWTDADFAQARPASEALPGEIAAMLVRPGRPLGSKTSDRKQVTLRLPKSVIDYFKSGGPGWQTRAVAVLEREATGRNAGKAKTLDEAVARGVAEADAGQIIDADAVFDRLRGKYSAKTRKP
jgi:uncharacterized protein (DUF4415 family)